MEPSVTIGKIKTELKGKKLGKPITIEKTPSVLCWYFSVVENIAKLRKKTNISQNRPKKQKTVKCLAT